MYNTQIENVEKIDQLFQADNICMSNNIAATSANSSK